jgi:hypothetical protein
MDTREPNFPDLAGEPSAADGCRTHAERAPPADALLLPVTKRGVIVATDKPSTIEIGIHWLSITAFTNPSNLVQHVMGELLGRPLSAPEEWDKVFADTGRSGRRYKKIFAGPLLRNIEYSHFIIDFALHIESMAGTILNPPR